MSARPLVVLDLDETLVHTRLVLGTPQETPDHYFFGDNYNCYVVVLRPHLRRFLKEVSDNYDIGIWTAGGTEYAQFVVSILPLEVDPVFVWDDRRCVKKTVTMSHELESTTIIIKPLAKIWRKGYYNKFTTVVVDNTPSTFSRNYGNAIQIKDFTGDENDDGLLQTLDVLNAIAHEPNLREALRKLRSSSIL